MAGDYKDGHDGDVGVTREGWQEMNCYLEENASEFSSTLSKFNSKVRFRKSNSAFLVLADSSDIVKS